VKIFGKKMRYWGMMTWAWIWAAWGGLWAQHFLSSEGGEKSLYGYAPNGRPLYRTTVGAADAKSVGADKLWTDYGLSGAGITVGLWDAGAVNAAHWELEGRVWVMDSSEKHSHATAVAGFIAAAGLRPEARGLAYQSRLLSYDWNDDAMEMWREAAAGLLISNHSYVPITGWFYDRNEERWEWYGDITVSQTEDAGFGAYTAWSAAWDSVAWIHPHYLVVAAAGNDRSNTGPGPDGEFFVYDPEVNDWAPGRFIPPGRDGGDNGFDCLPASGCGFNVLTVGAVYGLPDGWQGPESVVISNFSSFGPTDDGRVKPDLVAQGVDGYTLGPNTDYDYNTRFSGTSMAAPVVAGALALVQQYAQSAWGRALFSDEIKALAIHAADEAGDAPGPDFRFGWGLLNVEKMVGLLADTSSSGLMRKRLSARQTFYFGVHLDAGQSLKATVCWLNPPPAVRPAALNDSTPLLVHDLDLRIVGPDGMVYRPWVLDGKNPSAPALRGVNRRDNVEQVWIETAPVSGYYLVAVAAPERLSHGPQAFALVWQSSNPSNCSPIEIFQPDYSTLCRAENCTTYTASGRYAVATSVDCPSIEFDLTMPDVPTMKTYPVPASEMLNVEVYWNSYVPGAALELIDPGGKSLYSLPLPSAPGPKYFSLPVASLPDGIYVLRIKNTALRKKIVVAR
jgi:hypothetical protein